MGLIIAVVLSAASVTDNAIGMRLLDKVVEHSRPATRVSVLGSSKTLGVDVRAFAVRPLVATDHAAVADLFEECGLSEQADAFDQSAVLSFSYWVAVHADSLLGVIEADMDHDYGDAVAQLGFTPPHA